jgi:hypothetical protein
MSRWRWFPKRDDFRSPVWAADNRFRVRESSGIWLQRDASGEGPGGGYGRRAPLQKELRLPEVCDTSGTRGQAASPSRGMVDHQSGS